jgi:hypothetical protein
MIMSSKNPKTLEEYTAPAQVTYSVIVTLEFISRLHSKEPEYSHVSCNTVTVSVSTI